MPTSDYSENDETESNVVMQNVAENDQLPRGLLNSGNLCVIDNEQKDYNVTRELPKVRFPSCRLVLIFMGFLGFMNVYYLRINLSVALVAMVNHTQHASQSHNENNSDDICVTNESVGTVDLRKEEVKRGEFNWDSHTQGTVLAAFFYGYITTQV